MCGYMMFNGFWLIPMGICLIMMIFFGFRKRNGFYRPMYFNTENDLKDQNETALDILNKRYAKGEISSELYTRMKKEMG